MAEVTVQLSDNAAKRIIFLASKEGQEDAMLRITVEGGGCSGFQYHYDFPVWEKQEDDLVIKHEGATLLIDSISLRFLKGAIVDYVETLGSASFEIKNPNTSAQCGCGNSFAV